SRLLKFEEEGEFLKVVGSFGSNPGQLENPTDIAIGPGGNVWVAGWQDNRVSEFDKTGKFVQRFGEQGSGNGQFEHPDAIDVDEKGNVWVLDEGNSRVEHFNEKGKYLGKFGTEGSGEGQFGFHYPTGIATDSEEGIWVADGLNNRVQGWARGVPKATTESATAVEATLATLNATVNPEGRATSYWFEYGKTTSYGTKIPASPASVGSGTSNVAVSQTPKGLSESTEYHFRVVAESEAGTSKGADKTFTTLASSPSDGFHFVHDVDGRLKAAINPEGETATYGWDAAGNLLSVSRKPSSELSIIQLNPGSGDVGETIEIEGTGFSSTPESDTVEFNGTPATVVEASPWSLSVEVPEGASTGTVTVETPNAGPASSPEEFTIGNTSGPSIS